MMSSLSKRSEKRGKTFTEISTGILPSELIAVGLHAESGCVSE